MTKELEDALALILEDLEDSNAHTIYALLNWNYGDTRYNEETMLKAYKAAQFEIWGTQ